MADDSYGFRGPRIYGVPPGTPQQPEWAVRLENSDGVPPRTGRSQSPSVARKVAPAPNEPLNTGDTGNSAFLRQRRGQSQEELKTRPPTTLRSKTSVKDMAQQFQSTDTPQSPALARRVVDSPGRVVTSDIKTPESPEFCKKLKGFPELLRAWEMKNDELTKKNKDLNKENDQLNRRYENMERLAQGFRDEYRKVKKENDEMVKMRWKPHASTQGHPGDQQDLPCDHVEPYSRQTLEQETDAYSRSSTHYSEHADSTKAQIQGEESTASADGQDASLAGGEKRRRRFVTAKDRLITSVTEPSLTSPENGNPGHLKTAVSPDMIVELRVNLHLLPAITILSQTHPDKYSIENAYRTVRESMKIASACRKQNPAVSEALLGRCWFYMGVCRIARTVIDGTNYRPEICFEHAAAKATGVYPEAKKAEYWRTEWRQHMRDLQEHDDSRPVSSSSSVSSFWNGVKRFSGLSWAEKMERRSSVLDEEAEVGSPRGGRPNGRPRPQSLGLFLGGARTRGSAGDRHRTPRPGGFERIPSFSTMTGSAQSTEVSPTSATSQDSPTSKKPERVPTFGSVSSFNSQAQTPTDESFSPMGIEFQQQQKEKLMLGRQKRMPIDEDSPTQPEQVSLAGVGSADGDIKIEFPSPRSYDNGEDQIDLASASGSTSSIPTRRTQSMASVGSVSHREPGINDEDATLPAPATDRFKRHKSTASYILSSFAGAMGTTPSSSGSGTNSPRSSAKASGSDTSPSSATSSSSLSGGETLRQRRKSSFSNALSPLRAIATGRGGGNTLDSLREAEEGQSPYRSTFGEEGLVQRLKGAWRSGLHGNSVDGGESPGGGKGEQEIPRGRLWGPEDAGMRGSDQGEETPRPDHSRHGQSS